MDKPESIRWYWSEEQRLRLHRRTPPREGFCQCGTEKAIERSRHPAKMRAFLMVGVLLDQAVWTHAQDSYDAFRERFRIPKLYAHGGGGGMAHPSWLGYSHYGWDKEIDWGEVEAVAGDLLVPFFKWLADTRGVVAADTLRSTMSKEIGFGFEPAQAERLNSIVGSLEGPMDDLGGSSA